MITYSINNLLSHFNPDRETRAALTDERNWQPIETAPKDGTEIEVNYGTAENPEEVCLAFWSQRPVCMGGPMVSIKPGWATCGNDVDGNLPLDPPNFWRYID